MANGKNLLVIGGNGHVGQAVIHKADPSYHMTVMGRHGQNKAAMISICDGMIVAVPGKEFANIPKRELAIFLRSRKPVVIASTGYEIAPSVARRLQNRVCIAGGNFSLDMQLIRRALTSLSGKFAEAGLAPRMTIDETHDRYKLDGSATAQLWKEWIGRDDISIVPHRKAGAHPTHRLTMDFNSRADAEQGAAIVKAALAAHNATIGKNRGYTLSVMRRGNKVMLKHETPDRGIYAEGILWAAQQVASERMTQKGITTMEQLYDLMHPAHPGL